MRQLNWLQAVDPSRDFQGRIVLVVPHMDDEALACGGLLARLPCKERIQLIYATDGVRSPAPILPSRDKVSHDLGEIRVSESIAAMRVLGVPRDNLHFIRLPEANLTQFRPALEKELGRLLKAMQPDFVFVPFRYDRHPDHLVINHIVMQWHKLGRITAQLIEYFVYHRWRMLPGRDLRDYIEPRHLLQLDITPVAAHKRAALDCFRSQVTRMYAWQTRPILTPALLDEECRHPEIFLKHEAGAQGPAVFANSVAWIRLVHRLEQILQKWKYIGGALLRRGLKPLVNDGRRA
jgi:LmbE family N-acetylglucosaminyl deacetylase